METDSDRPVDRATSWVHWTIVCLFVPTALLAGNLSRGAALPAAPPEKVMIGDTSAGSRAEAAHIIPLRDPEGDTIQPDDRLPLPFSISQTCGADCHDVKRIGRGWHFNANLPGVPPGRKGQPWLLIDAETGTQLPLSYRCWPGTYTPPQLGMSAKTFALLFGGRMAGGLSAGDDAGTRRDRVRWSVSGDLEANCLACHDGSPAYDPAEYARQITLENFRYAPAAASGLALVSGSAKEMPNFFDYLLPHSVEDALQPKVPRVDYARNRFLPGQKVAFDIVREAKASRCYYCHTNVDVEETGAFHWRRGQDVHLARGITCVECHRNGLDHAMIRGYEGEAAALKDPFAASLSCRGCHMGPDDKENPRRGHTSGPYPKHAGIPPIHLERLTCTACHSGPAPAANTRRMKNGLAHGLGEHNVNKAQEALPHIYYPVFAQQEDGKIAPHRMIWPAFWGRIQSRAVQPIPPDQVKHAMREGKLKSQPPPDGSWSKINKERVAAVLRLLAEQGGARYSFGYVAGGRLHRLDATGKLVAEDHEQARPYLWPLAHDVRPASQALGARGCEDCHSEDSAIFFGNVAVDSPLGLERPWKMHSFEKKLDVAYAVRLARSWPYRPWVKAGALSAAALLLLVVIAYVARAWDSLSARVAGPGAERKHPEPATGD